MNTYLLKEHRTNRFKVYQTNKELKINSDISFGRDSYIVVQELLDTDCV